MSHFYELYGKLRKLRVRLEHLKNISRAEETVSTHYDFQEMVDLHSQLAEMKSKSEVRF